MTWITFTQDVRPEGDSSANPLYKVGDCHDVSENEALRCIRKGIAVRGKVSIEPPAKPARTEPVSETAFRGYRSKPYQKKSPDKKADD